jgi:hypothetical protein
MIFVIIGLLVFDVTIITIWTREKIVETRPKYRVVIHMLNGNPLVWYSDMSWPETMRHLPHCMSRLGDDREKAWEVTPP